MNIPTNEQIKRRGIAAVEEALRTGPVHLVKRNRPAAPKRTSLEVFMSMGDRPGGIDAKGLAARIEQARGGWNER